MTALGTIELASASTGAYGDSWGWADTPGDYVAESFWWPDGTVSSEACRVRLRNLRDRGIDWDAIVEASGLPRPRLVGIAHEGVDGLTPQEAGAILGMNFDMDMTWQEGARCSRLTVADVFEETGLVVEEVGDVFFPSSGPVAAKTLPAARRLCAVCPVREACLEHALVWEDAGVWGGTSEKERNRIRRERGGRAAVRKGEQ